MTPKEKAKELWEKFYERTESPSNARTCAIICVDEVLMECNWELYEYWEQVKTEIENL